MDLFNIGNTENAAIPRSQKALEIRQMEVQEQNAAANMASSAASAMSARARMQELTIKQEASRIRLVGTAMQGVTDQESFDNAMELILTAMTPDAKEKADMFLKRLYGERYDKARIERGNKFIKKLGDKFKAYYAVGAGGLYDVEKGEVIPPAPKEFAPKFDLFEFKNGSIDYVKQGDPVPKNAVKLLSRGITINTGDLSKTTSAELEQAIVRGVQSIKSFQRIEEMFDRSYLTYVGKGLAKAYPTADSLGMTTEQYDKWHDGYQKWFQAAKEEAIKFRKWATGVAGGPIERADIATAFPDPVNNSPNQYLSNLQGVERTAIEVLKLNDEFLKSGIDTTLSLSEIYKQIHAKGLNIKEPPGGIDYSTGGSQAVSPPPDQLTPEQEVENFKRENPGW